MFDGGEIRHKGAGCRNQIEATADVVDNDGGDVLGGRPDSKRCRNCLSQLGEGKGTELYFWQVCITLKNDNEDLFDVVAVITKLFVDVTLD